MSRMSLMAWIMLLIAGSASAGTRDTMSSDPGPAFVNAAAETEEIFVNGFELFTLTIDNFLSWCSISVGGDVPSIAATISKTFSQGSVVTLQGAPTTGFVWGYWTGTDAGGNDTNQTTQVTMSSDRGVFACCPFPTSSTCP